MGGTKPRGHLTYSDWKTLLVLLFIAILLRGFWLAAVMERDEGYFAYSSWLMVSGEGSIATNQFHNFPAITFVYASLIRLFGNTILPMKLLNFLLFLLSVPFLYRAGGMALGKKVAVAGTLLYILSMNIPAFEGPLAKTTSLATPFMVLGAYFLVRSHFGTRGMNLAMSALFFIIAFLFRPTQGFGLVLVVADVVLTHKEQSASPRRRRQHLAGMALLSAGAAAVGVTILLLFVQPQGIPQNTIWRTILKASYFLHPTFQLSYPQPVGMFIMEGLFLIPLLLLGLYCLWHRAERSKGHDRVLGRVFLLWFFLSFTVTVLPPMFGYFYQQMIPPLSIVGGIGLMRLVDLMKRVRGIAWVAAGGFFFTILIISFYYQSLHFPDFNSPTLRERWGHWTYSDVESFLDQQEIAAFISEHTPQNRTVVLWSRDYGILFLAERRGPRVLVSPDFFCLNKDNVLPAPGTPLEEMELFLMNLLEGSPLELDTQTVEFSRQEFERIVANDDFASVATFVMFPNIEVPCYNLDKPLFSEKVQGWNRSEVGGAIIFFRE